MQAASRDRGFWLLRGTATVPRAVQATGLLGAPAVERFDKITRLARGMFDVPVAIIDIRSIAASWTLCQPQLDASTARSIAACGTPPRRHMNVRAEMRVSALRFRGLTPTIEG